MKSIAVLASGRGSNFASIIKYFENNDNIVIKLLLASKDNIGAIDIAKEHNIEYVVLRKKDFSSNKQFGEYFLNILNENNIDLVVLAGYLKKIPDIVIDNYYPMIINIHPALLPAFGGKGYYGLNVHRAVIESGVFYSGLTIHFVNKEYDKGPIIFQKVVEVREYDEPESLANRILKFEHEYYPLIIEKVLTKKFKIKNNRVIFD